MINFWMKTNWCDKNKEDEIYISHYENLYDTFDHFINLYSEEYTLFVLISAVLETFMELCNWKKYFLLTIFTFIFFHL